MNIIGITTELKDFFIAVVEQIAPYILTFIDFVFKDIGILVFKYKFFFFPFYPLWIFTDPFM
jgi:hypothetical protein